MNVIVNVETPLSSAVDSGNLDLVEFLVANGGDINQEIPCVEKGTVLHMACVVRNANLLSIRFNLILG